MPPRVTIRVCPFWLQPLPEEQFDLKPEITHQITESLQETKGLRILNIHGSAETTRSYARHFFHATTSFDYCFWLSREPLRLFVPHSCVTQMADVLDVRVYDGKNTFGNLRHRYEEERKVKEWLSNPGVNEEGRPVSWLVVADGVVELGELEDLVDTKRCRNGVVVVTSKEAVREREGWENVVSVAV